MRLFALTAVVMVAFAANSLLNRAALAGTGNDPMAFALVRVVAGAITLALIAGARGGWGWAGRIRWGGALMLALYLAGFSLAYLRLDAGAGALILFAGVQLTMFGGAVLGADAVPPRRWIGSGLALAGLAWMLLPGAGAVPWPSAALMAAAALGWGIFSLMARGVTDPLGVTAGAFLGAVPVVALAALGFGAPTSLDAAGLGLAVLSGAATSGLGYALWYGVVPRLGATRAALAQLSVPVIAVLGGAAILGEGVGLRLVLSCALVVGGIAIGLRPPKA